MSHTLKNRAIAAYKARFKAEPAASAFAPGRVNLMGEHTDYNGGCVLPVTLDLGIGIALGPAGRPGEVRLVSDGFAGEEVRRVGEGASGSWSDYAFGALLSVAETAIKDDGLCVAVTSDLPSGAGLSSSAAIEVAAIRAAGAFHGKGPDPVATAIIARSVENDFVGMPCGVMDQFAVSVGHPGSALFLDTATLSHEAVPLLADHSFVVVHSGVSHKLTDDGYALRVQECSQACAALGVDALGELGLDALESIAALPEPLARRARHVVTENARVASAVSSMREGDPETLGSLMLASHKSQRDDYDVSVPEVDALVEGVMAFEATGARLTGGGFGGSIVALVRSNRVDEIVDQLTQNLPKARLLATIDEG